MIPGIFIKKTGYVPMRAERLTDLEIRNKKPAAKPYKLYDGKGLFLLIGPNTKQWRLRFYLDGKEGLYAIGRYGDAADEYTLSKARVEAAQARALVKQGINPVSERQRLKQENLEATRAAKLEADGAFSKVVTAWLENGHRQWCSDVLKGRRRRIEKYLIPKLGRKPLQHITAADIRPLLESCRKVSEWTAIRVKTDLAGLFRYGMVRGLIDNNPVIGLAGLIPVPASESKAVLTLKQIREFFTNLAAHRGLPETAICLKLLALTVVRPSEAAEAEWSEFDFDDAVWRIPAGRMKEQEAHTCPLSPAALAALRELQPITGNSRYLFPHRSDIDRPCGQPRLAQAMRGMALGNGASPHCWRTTFSTWANEQGFRPDAIEKQLAHAERNKVRATYNKALLLGERRKMMDEWADYLTAIESPNVVLFRRSQTEIS